MTEVYYEVPRLDQHKIFPTKSRNMACWYTCSLMLILFRMGIAGVSSSININTLKRLFVNNGLLDDEDANLASEFGFEHSNTRELLQDRKISDYGNALNRVGPLIISQASHVLLVTGAKNGSTSENLITYNDPDGGKQFSLPLEEFNSMIAWKYPVHYRRSRLPPPSVLAAGPNKNPFKTKY